MDIERLDDHMALRCKCGSVKWAVIKSGKIECHKCQKVRDFEHRDIRLDLLEGKGSTRKLELTERQKEIVIMARDKYDLTSNDLVFLLDMSIQNASGSLVNLFNKGYLTRVNIGDPSGGHQFLYSYALGK